MQPKKVKLTLNVLVLLIPIILSINSCTSKTDKIQPIKKIETIAKPVEKTSLNLAHPPTIQLDEVKWIIITKENAQIVFEELDKSGTDAVLFGLTDDNYEILSKNLAHIRAHIIQQKEIITQYKNYYE